MTVAPGSRLGPYQIVESIGAGGMGEVYRATDTRLDRPVAIKVLPAHLSSGAGMRERFEREARAISSLSHPNICSLFDLGRHDGVDYLVMELLEGQTLAERIARGPLPTEQILRYGREIASALDKAHRQKIIHRDLKPGNVFLTRSGVKLLDFGLAKFTAAQGAVPLDGPTAVQERERPLTAEGSLIGTIPYMSPEQLEGKDVDERSDIFSLGAILYEMATGRRPFQGSNQASLIASILTHEPQPVSELRSTTPPSLDRLIRACLEKNPDDRVQTAHDVMLQLQWISESSGTENKAVASAGRASTLRRYLPWLAAAAIALAAVLFAALRTRGPVETVVEFALSPPGASGLFGVYAAISPDGSTIVTPANDGSNSYALWARAAGSTKWRRIEGTERGNDQMKPFFSPDGKSIGYFSDRQLRVVDLAGGAWRDVCPAAYGVGGAWLDDGSIVFSPAFGEPMHRVSAAGGAPSIVPGFQPIAKEAKQGWPVPLPKGRFLFLEQKNASEHPVIFGASVSGAGPRRIAEATSLVGYSEPWLLFVRKGTLFAQRFDADAMALEGDPVPLANPVAHSSIWMHSGASVSGRTLIYPPALSRERSMRWVSRAAEPVETILRSPNIYFGALAPDDRRILYFKEDMAAGDTTLWTYDLARGIEAKLTTVNTASASWSPDGRFIAHDAGSGGTNGVYVQKADGSEPARFLGTTGGSNEFIGSWLSDRAVLVERFTPQASFDLWRMPVDGAKPEPIVATEFNEYGVRLSPNGGWFAYQTTRSGRSEIVARNIASGETIQISNRGGAGVEWSDREIFFVDGEGDLQAVPYTITGTSLQLGNSQRLFAFPPESAYDVTRDGQKILLSTAAGQTGQRDLLHVLVGWKSRLF